MGQSHVKRRARERPLKEHRVSVAQQVDVVCSRSGHTPDDAQRRAIINEVVSLADPHAVAGIDIVIPAGRKDLARTWILYRLSGVIENRSDVERFARTFAPDPDPAASRLVLASDCETTDRVATAFQSRRRRKQSLTSAAA